MSTPSEPLPKLDLTHTPENDAFDALQTVTPTPHPYRLRGKVVHGFGRGSKLLGCPTANLDPAAFEKELTGVQRGVYIGYAQVKSHGGDAVYPAVLSLGTAPTFVDSVNETVEAYILHDFSSDFYDSTMSLIILGFMRSMEKYTSMDELIKAIARDVRVGEKTLKETPYVEYKEDVFFKEDTKEKSAEKSKE